MGIFQLAERTISYVGTDEGKVQVSVPTEEEIAAEKSKNEIRVPTSRVLGANPGGSCLH